jgi:tetratricopeptide (TPR) repeat protein
MRPLLVCMLLCAFLGACSEEEPGRPGGQALIQTDPLAEVKAELARDPRNADAWLHLADLYERSGMYAEEADALTKVVSIDPKRGFAYMKLGTTYNRLGRYADAVSRFQKAKQYLSKNPVLYNNLAFSYGKLNKTDEQIASLKQAIVLRPGYATARYNLGMAYLKQKRNEDALKQYDALKNIDMATAVSLKKEIDARR